MSRATFLLVFFLTFFSSESYISKTFKNYKNNLQAGPVVYLSQGAIEGSYSYSRWSRRTIYQFRGIPFAKPPLGELRFKPPEPAESWEGIWDSTQFGQSCPISLGAQLFPDISYKDYPETGKEEDCLFINVYTPTLKADAVLPVMFYIHGGGFAMRSAREFRPELLLERNVILVVPQYRLGPLGFLSADVDSAPGNAGLLDMLLALHWVRDNIGYFGGDPEKVTIFGQSAGAGATSLMLFSPLVESDLFQKTIFQSGSALGTWILDEQPIKSSRGVAKFANCTNASIEKEIECLKGLSYVDVLKAHSRMLMEASLKGEPTFGATSPVLQKVGSQQFLTKAPHEMFSDGKFLRKPILAGVVAHEGSFMIGDLYNALNLVPGLLSEDFLKHNLTRLILKKGGLKDTTGFLEQILKEKYFKSDELGNFTLMTKGLIDLAGSAYLKSPVFTLAQEMSRSYPSYLYSLNYVGRYTKIGYGKPVNYPFSGGVAHSDDLLYLFPHEGVIMNEEEEKISKEMVEFWTSFASTGQPTTSNGDVEWAPITTEKGPYLRIDKDLNMRDNFLKEYLVAVDEGLPEGPSIPIE